MYDDENKEELKPQDRKANEATYKQPPAGGYEPVVRNAPTSFVDY